jgi:chaperonin cofactor prefoldin
MIKSGFSYLKWTAVVAVLALTVIAGVRPSTATKQPPATAVSGADLANEERALAKYFDDLVTYNHQTTQLSKKASFTLAEIDPLQRRSDDLKGRLSGLQNVIREIVVKLKKADEWSDLDASVVDPNFRSFSQQISFKDLLEESSNSLTSHGNEISTPLDNLRKKLTSRYGDGAGVQFVRAAYVTPAPMKFISLGCTIGGIRWKLINKLGGVATDKTADQVSCACGNSTGIGTGTPCSQVN